MHISRGATFCVAILPDLTHYTIACHAATPLACGRDEYGWTTLASGLPSDSRPTRFHEGTNRHRGPAGNNYQTSLPRLPVRRLHSNPRSPAFCRTTYSCGRVQPFSPLIRASRQSIAQTSGRWLLFPALSPNAQRLPVLIPTFLRGPQQRVQLTRSYFHSHSRRRHSGTPRRRSTIRASHR